MYALGHTRASGLQFTDPKPKDNPNPKNHSEGNPTLRNPNRFEYAKQEMLPFFPLLIWVHTSLSSR